MKKKVNLKIKTDLISYGFKNKSPSIKRESDNYTKKIHSPESIRHRESLHDTAFIKNIVTLEHIKSKNKH